ncbi:hypothetical protein POSPLADRAFT_1058481 [Postia placenta MAD-698-R-SB12]|uniref:Uncharacterized protein n=1 Tax=Postia placenta MAD-698-R-SB12 TaxID=670580 RepID=A0A1X6MVB4_9APHY|nr:hypothetical protein POSPLADRAFT_1058481 [Postia placenta MAD-698-R-SB12]OSX60308.1 hypothetical protein POSPLADRAFT_1058481 [Postia placenta MAD-698-R-SB12]
MSSSSSLSPPPRMHSPQPIQAPLPSPPILPRRSSRNRLHLPAHPEDPPIPPRLIGSPLLKKMTVRPDEPHLLSTKAQSELWIDGDEFGTRRRQSASPMASPPLSTSPSSPRYGHRRSSSIVGANRSRSHSPPPTPALASPPPPVPPIPSFALATPGAKRSVVRSPPAHRTQIQIPNLDLAPQYTLTSPSKSNRWARPKPYSQARVELSVFHSSPRRVAA